jgi:DNA-binding NarL/FixJ family response regulator
MKVVIAEHSTGMRACLVQTFAQIQNVQVVASVPDFSNAVEAIVGTRPDVLIVSANLLGGSGLDLLGAVTQIAVDVFTIYIGANLSEAVRERCALFGADIVFEKPHGIRALLKLIEAMAEELPCSV